MVNISNYKLPIKDLTEAKTIHVSTEADLRGENPLSTETDAVSDPKDKD